MASATLLERNTVGDTDAEHVMCSIAVSLKRIADALAGDERNSGLIYMLDQIAVGAQGGRS